METPGFAEENKTKPAETKAIEDSGGTFSAAAAADHLWSGLSMRRYAITNELLCEIARIGVNGSTPRPHVLLEALLAPLTVIIGLVLPVFNFFIFYPSTKILIPIYITHRWGFTFYMDYVVQQGRSARLVIHFLSPSTSMH